MSSIDASVNAARASDSRSARSSAVVGEASRRFDACDRRVSGKACTSKRSASQSPSARAATTRQTAGVIASSIRWRFPHTVRCQQFDVASLVQLDFRQCERPPECYSSGRTVVRAHLRRVVHDERRRAGCRSRRLLVVGHAAADAQDRDRSAEASRRRPADRRPRRASIHGCSSVAVLPHGQREARILDVDHARHERAVGRQLQLVLRQLDRNRKAQREARAADRGGRSARSSERFPDPGLFGMSVTCSRYTGPICMPDERVVRLAASQSRLPWPVRSERLAAPGSAPAGSTLTTVRLGEVVGCQSLPEAWHRHLASALAALGPRP